MLVVVVEGPWGWMVLLDTGTPRPVAAPWEPWEEPVAGVVRPGPTATAVTVVRELDHPTHSDPPSPSDSLGGEVGGGTVRGRTEMSRAVGYSCTSRGRLLVLRPRLGRLGPKIKRVPVLLENVREVCVKHLWGRPGPDGGGSGRRGSTGRKEGVPSTRYVDWVGGFWGSGTGEPDLGGYGR